MSQFSFPVLENEELLHCLSDMEIQVDVGSLSKPTYEAFRPVFEHLVIELTGVTRSGLDFNRYLVDRPSCNLTFTLMAMQR